MDFGTEFLDHSPTSAGSGFLKNWKEDGRIVGWMHPKAPNISVWSHNWYRIAKMRDKDKKETLVIKGKRVNCLENEELLKKQRWRDSDDVRKVPPVMCPHCLCLEWVREQVNAGKLEWSTPIFEFKTPGDTPIGGEKVKLYAGGFTGLFQRRDLSEQEVEQVRRTGVKVSEAYKQNGAARQQYVFAFLPASDLGAGWMIAIEGPTLGEKMRKCIKDEIKRCKGDVQLGHPAFNPYPFEWNYDDNKQFDDKYDVVALTRDQVTEKVRVLLDKEPPDVAALIADPKLGTLYDSMKAAALVQMPFDQFFERAFDALGRHYEDGEDGEEGEEPGRGSVPESAKPSMVAEVASDDGGDEAEMIGCDVCDATMAETDMSCKECGAEYATSDKGDVYLAARGCGNCRARVAVQADGGEKCGKCGAVHTANWEFTLPALEAKRSRSRSAATSPSEPEPERKHADAEPSRRSRARAAASSKG